MIFKAFARPCPRRPGAWPGVRAALLSLSIGGLMAPQTARAIIISESKFIELGGNLDEMQDTFAQAVSRLRAPSLASQFLAVGRIERCTATWLGERGDHSYLLTAAHCVPVGNGTRTAVRRTFLDWRGRIIAQGDGWAARPPMGTREGGRWDHCGDDLAVVRLPRVATPSDLEGRDLTPPTMAEVDLETGEPVQFVGYGARGVGKQFRVWDGGDVRTLGESVVAGFFLFDRGFYLQFEPSTASMSWATPSFGDSGSAVWRLRHGDWQMAGVHAAIVESRGHAISPHLPRYARWIKDVFPGTVLDSERTTVTETTPFVSRIPAGAPSGPSVYHVVPGQADAVGPSVGRSSGRPGRSMIAVKVKESHSGRMAEIRLRAQRWNGCASLPIEDAAPCLGSRGNRMAVEFHREDNPDLPPGAYRGAFDLDRLAWEDRSRQERLRLRLDIRHLARGQLTTAKPFVSQALSPRAPREPVFYTVPTQPRAQGPTAGVWVGSPQHSRIEATVRDAVSGREHPVVLRAFRGPLCGRWPLRMEDGVTCQGQSAGPVTVRFHPEDNPALPEGLHRGQVLLQAHGAAGSPADQLIELDIELDTLWAGGNGP